ncbi:MAG: winged helix-turn-helix domain-containing protein [Pseudomonadota bacterium]
MNAHLDPRTPPSIWRFAKAQFDEASLVLTVDGQPVSLERKPLEVLKLLLSQAGEVVTKDELLAAVWPGVVVVDDVVSVAVAKLRKGLRDTESNIIATVRGYGYRFVAEISRSAQRAIAESHEPAPLAAGQGAPGREKWRLQECLGKGGFGEVWLARHEKTNDSRVFKYAADGAGLSALKKEVTLHRLLKQTYGDRPEFVRLHEWQFDEAPFFIEYDYGGVSLQDWAKQRLSAGDWPLTQRLELARQLAGIVALAHAAGVLHRDLKPANVLIAVDEGRLLVRLTDFGIGHLIQPDALEARQITQLGFTQAIDAAAGSPLYTAPEVLAGLPSTAQADVYALGVILYQLIVGDLGKPLVAGWEADIADPLLRQDIADAANGHPDRRLGSAAELEKRLATLDDRRAQWQARLADEQATTSARAVLAKQRARRPWLIATAATLLMALSVSSVLLWRERAARTLADDNIAIATAINEFVKNDLIAAANPRRGGNPNVLLKDAMTKAASAINTRFAGQPELELAIRREVGAMFSGLGSYAPAAEQFKLGLALAERMGASAQQAALWKIDLAETQLWINDREGATASATTAYETLKSSLGIAHPDTLKAQRVLARIPYVQGDSAAAEPLFAALLPHLNAPGVSPIFSRQIRTTWASIQLNLERYAAAEPLLKALTVETVPPSEDPSLGPKLQYLLGVSLNGQRKYDESAQALQKARTATAALLGEMHNDTLGVDAEIARLATHRQDWATAEAGYSALAEKYRNTLGADHSLALSAELNKIVVIRSRGRNDEALKLLEDLHTRTLKLRGEAHPYSLMQEWELAYLDALMGRPQRGEARLAGLESRGQKAFPGDNQWYPRMSFLKAKLLAVQGKREQAVAALGNAAKGLAAIVDPNDPVVKDAQAIERLL